MTDHHNEDHVTIIVPVNLAGTMIEALRSAGRPVNDPRIDEILTFAQRNFEMSQNLQATVDANNLATSTALDAIGVDVGKITDELHASIPAAGTVLTQESIDAMTANVTRLQGVKTALDALAAPGAPASEPTPAEPAPIAFNSADPTPNSPGGRNTPGADPANPLPGFDPNQPVTA
jgi:hypothetical protein